MLRSNPDERDVVVLGGTVAIVLGAMYWILRTGFYNPMRPVINSVAFSLFLMVLPLVVESIGARLLGRTPPRWYLKYPFLWLCALVVSAMLGYIVPLTGINPFDAILFSGIAGFAVTIVLWAREKGVIRAAGYLSAAAAFGVWSGGVVWGRIYKNPLYLESLISTGTAHHDALHLAALGNMLRTYHAASIGIDGLTYEPYHWGTAWLFVQWANLIGLDVLGFYQLAFPVIGIPLFFGGISVFAISIRNRRYSAESERSAGGWRFWALLLVVSIGFVPIGGLDAMGVWTSNILISESYTIAVPVALLMAATSMAFLDDPGVDHARPAKAPLRKRDFLFLLVLVPLAIGVLGYLKISLMVLSFAALAFFLVRFRLLRRAVYATSGLLAAAVFLFVFPRVSLPAHREGFVPFDFLSSFVPLQWWPFFVFIHLFWAWVYVAVRLRGEGIVTLHDLGAAIAGRRIIDVEVVSVIALLGILPGLAIHIDGGSAFYFSDVQRWLAAGLLMSLIVKRGTSQSVDRKTGIGSWPARNLLWAFLLLAIVGSGISNAVHWPLEMVRLNVKIRSSLYSRAGHPPTLSRVRDFGGMLDPELLAAGLAASPNYDVVKTLEQIRKLPMQEKRHAALFISQHEMRYWKMLSRDGSCGFDSFVAPAVATVALIDGTPPFGCNVSRYYGLGSYPARTRNEMETDSSPSSLCTRAQKMAADRVIVLSFGDSVTTGTQPAANAPRSFYRIVNCRAPT